MKLNSNRKKHTIKAGERTRARTVLRSRLVTTVLAATLFAAYSFIPSIPVSAREGGAHSPEAVLQSTPPPRMQTLSDTVIGTFSAIETEEVLSSLTHETQEESQDLGIEETVEPSEADSIDVDPQASVTQEVIAHSMEPTINPRAGAGSRITYPYPAGAMAVALYKDGKRILQGQVADIGGTVYVPVQRFADLFGQFKTVYTEATEQVVITGKNLSITVKVGDPYITVNERIFYTGSKVLSLGGWIFVPLTSMCKALDADVTIRPGYYDAFITSGDPTSVPWASSYYDSTDLYWLSRIISAESKGEPFAGQIAVGNVVLNRVRSSQFPNTVKGVIFDTKYGTQFSPVASGTIYNTPTASSVRAAKICLEGFTYSTKMIYFYNPSISTSSWIGRTRPYIMTIGNHKFYG